VSEEEGPVEILSFWGKAIVGAVGGLAVLVAPIYLILRVVSLGAAVIGLLTFALVCAVTLKTLMGSWRHPMASPAFGGLLPIFATAATWNALGAEEAGLGALFFLVPVTLAAQSGALFANYRYSETSFKQIAARRISCSAKRRMSIRSAMTVTAVLAVLLGGLKFYGLLTGTFLAVAACSLFVGATYLWGIWAWSIVAAEWQVRRELALEARKPFAEL
jgi:hypothetical protein